MEITVVIINLPTSAPGPHLIDGVDAPADATFVTAPSTPKPEEILVPAIVPESEFLPSVLDKDSLVEEGSPDPGILINSPDVDANEIHENGSAPPDLDANGVHKSGSAQVVVALDSGTKVALDSGTKVDFTPSSLSHVLSDDDQSISPSLSAALIRLNNLRRSPGFIPVSLPDRYRSQPVVPGILIDSPDLDQFVGFTPSSRSLSHVFSDNDQSIAPSLSSALVRLNNLRRSPGFFPVSLPDQYRSLPVVPVAPPSADLIDEVGLQSQSQVCCRCFNREHDDPMGFLASLMAAFVEALFLFPIPGANNISITCKVAVLSGIFGMLLMALVKASREFWALRRSYTFTEYFLQVAEISGTLLLCFSMLTAILSFFPNLQFLRFPSIFSFLFSLLMVGFHAYPRGSYFVREGSRLRRLTVEDVIGSDTIFVKGNGPGSV